MVISASMAAYVFAKILLGAGIALYPVSQYDDDSGAGDHDPQLLGPALLGLLNSFLGVLAPSIFNAFAVFLLRQNMRTIPDAFSEAAIIDGASYATIFLKIIAPLSKPVLAALTVITFMGAWNDYLWPLIVLTDRTKMTLPVGLSLLNTQYGNQYDLLMDGGLISMLPILVLYFLAQKQFQHGLSIGGDQRIS